MGRRDRKSFDESIKTLAFVSSPLQLFNILNSTDDKLDFIVVVGDDLSTYRPIIDHYSCSAVVECTAIGKFLDILNFSETRKIIKLSLGRRVLFGSYFNWAHFLASLVSESSCLYDDGTEVLALVDESRKYDFRLKRLVFKLLLKIIYRVSISEVAPDLATIFKTRGHEKLFNHISRSGNKKEIDFVYDKQEIWIVLSPVVELGILDYEVFYDSLKRLVKDLLSNHGDKKIVIQAHRRSCISYLNRELEGVEDYELRISKTALELKILIDKRGPGTVISYGSTFSVNLAELFNYHCSQNIIIDYSGLALKNSSRVRKLFSWYRNERKYHVRCINENYNF